LALFRASFGPPTGPTTTFSTAWGVLGISGVELLEVRLLWPFLGFSRKFARGELEKTAAADAGGRRLTPPSQGRQDVLGAAVLPFREPLAQLAEDRARYPVSL
jgi:hypothetical protein